MNQILRQDYSLDRTVKYFKKGRKERKFRIHLLEVNIMKYFSNWE